MKICIFCSANDQIDPEFFQLTEELGKWAAQQGHTIVYGGVNCGLMECVSKAAQCDNLSDRKQLMEDQSDVFIALPGGLGTLDEVFTIAASATIGYHQKRVILYNMKGFWDKLIAMLDELQAKGLTRKPWRTYIKVANNLDEIKDFLAQG